jgi:hypothetical protein
MVVCAVGCTVLKAPSENGRHTPELSQDGSEKGQRTTPTEDLAPWSTLMEMEECNSDDTHRKAHLFGGASSSSALPLVYDPLSFI